MKDLCLRPWIDTASLSLPVCRGTHRLSCFFCWNGRFLFSVANCNLRRLYNCITMSNFGQRSTNTAAAGNDVSGQKSSELPS